MKHELKTFSLRIPVDVLRKLHVKAKQDRRSANATAVVAIEAFVDHANGSGADARAQAAAGGKGEI